MISLVSLLVAVSGQSVTVSSTPPAGRYEYTVTNRAPLRPDAFSKLPIGSIKPLGWVRKQLELEANGYTGYLTKISPWLEKRNNAWLSPTGQGDHGWEEVPYWLKGFIDLGYVLDNRRIEKESKVWIDGALSSRRPNGYFGPESNLTANNGKPDVWPNMGMLYALRTYFEATGDKRVLSLLTGYFHWELTIPDPDFLLSYWEPQRVGDNIDSVYWLYNRTGDRRLLDLVEKLHRGGAKWTKGVANWHGVNMAQGFREPAQYGELHNASALDSATEKDYQTMRADYGEVPGGMYGADENCRPGYTDPRQAAETCAMVEMMFSDEMLLGITGNPAWAERCEDVTFNSLPASMTPDEKALHYLTSPNMVQIDKGSKSPDLQNGGPMLLFNAYDHRCCQHNAAMGWPYYAEHLWMGSGDNGLAALLYAPCSVTAKAGKSGVPVTIEESTNYPFDETVSFRMRTPRPVKFPLTLRWPSWCVKPIVAVDGKRLSFSGQPGGYITIDRVWNDRSTVSLGLPMQVRVVSWAGNKGSESVERGPLTYSLKIGEKYVRAGGSDAFPSYEVYPTTSWNYGLLTTGQQFRVIRKPFPSDQQPFTPNSAPIEILAKARKIPEWQMDRLGVVGLLQSLPARTMQPVEQVELVPMGAARLRISAFPTVSPSASAIKWVAPPKAKPSLPASASHVFEGDTLTALSDGILPSNSDDQSIPRFTWWDRRGTTEWVEYDFPAARSVGRVGVYWFDDQPTGGQCRTPESWKMLSWEDGKWVEVEVMTLGYGVEKDKFNWVSFRPVSTAKLRIEVKLRPTFSSGILEWELR